MNRTIIPAILVVLSCVLSGCIVRAIYPWLSEDSKATDVSLVGTWRDIKEDETAFFTSSSKTNYNILLVSDKKDQSRFTASLHRIDKMLLLVVGPQDRDGMGNMVLLPGYLLFRVELDGNSMRLFGLDIDSFGDRLEKGKIKRLEEGDKDKGYILFSRTEELSSFIKSQLKDKSFFDEKPMYTFKRLAEK